MQRLALPVDAICIILSFLPARKASALALLSRRFAAAARARFRGKGRLLCRVEYIKEGYARRYTASDEPLVDFGVHCISLIDRKPDGSFVEMSYRFIPRKNIAVLGIVGNLDFSNLITLFMDASGLYSYSKNKCLLTPKKLAPLLRYSFEEIRAMAQEWDPHTATMVWRKY